MDRLLSEADRKHAIRLLETIAVYDVDRYQKDKQVAIDIAIEAIKAIPSAYKGMTNGEVLEAVFPNIDFCRNEFDSSMWVDMEDIAAFEQDWWNSPYEPQEGANE